MEDVELELRDVELEIGSIGVEVERTWLDFEGGLVKVVDVVLGLLVIEEEQEVLVPPDDTVTVTSLDEQVVSIAVETEEYRAPRPAALELLLGTGAKLPPFPLHPAATLMLW